uniref:(northern house mosquito) hypothetical protein n=1 Tax=Culex pipiens TaxID=7175 RepID=A0A8D8GKP6_CULPI
MATVLVHRDYPAQGYRRGGVDVDYFQRSAVTRYRQDLLDGHVHLGHRSVGWGSAVYLYLQPNSGERARTVQLCCVRHLFGELAVCWHHSHPPQRTAAPPPTVQRIFNIFGRGRSRCLN